MVELTGLTGILRIDFLSDGTEVFVNEVNSIPGALALYLWPDTPPAEVLIAALEEAERPVPTATRNYEEGVALRAAGGIASKLAGLPQQRRFDSSVSRLPAFVGSSGQFDRRNYRLERLAVARTSRSRATAPSDVPLMVQANGNTEVSVVPGVIAVSSTTKQPSASTMKSERETSRRPRARWASRATSPSRSSRSSGRSGLPRETNSAV